MLLALAACLAGASAAGATSAAETYQRLDHGRVTTTRLPADTRMVAVYYGASWYGPCRAFVPELIAAYPRLRARGIEVLFVSDDASCATALDYARTSRMPWLLLPCDPRRHAKLRALAKQALPGIVVLDHSGAPMRTSWHRDGSSTPRTVLRALLN